MGVLGKMPFYHVYVVTKSNQRLFAYDLPKRRLDKLLRMYVTDKTFNFLGTETRRSDISEFEIFESVESGRGLRLPNGKLLIDENDTSYVAQVFREERVKGFSNVTHLLWDVTEEELTTTAHAIRIDKKDKVFIGHGRDLKEALELQKYLRDDLKVDALMFEDLKKKSGCKTIIELLDYFKENVGYAFIIFTPDDYGCLCEEFDELINRLYRDKKKSRTEVIDEINGVLKKRARENVVFELGLFIGALPRDKVCYLLQKDVADTPSNMDGVLHEPFGKSISDTFIAITEKLKNAGLLQKKEI